VGEGGNARGGGKKSDDLRDKGRGTSKNTPCGRTSKKKNPKVCNSSDSGKGRGKRRTRNATETHL